MWHMGTWDDPFALGDTRRGHALRAELYRSAGRRGGRDREAG